MAHGPDTDRMFHRIREFKKRSDKAIRSLDLMNLDITSLPKLPHGITHLNCDGTKISFIKQLPTTLIILRCARAELNEISSLPPFLKELYCDNNRGLRSLPELPSSLEYLDCAYCDLRSIPVLPDNLTKFFCCHNKNLISLPNLPKPLLEFDFINTNIVDFPILPNTLTYLRTDLSVDVDIPNTMRFLTCKEGVFYRKELIAEYNEEKAALRSIRRCLDRVSIIKPELIMTLYDPEKIRNSEV